MRRHPVVFACPQMHPIWTGMAVSSVGGPCSGGKIRWDSFNDGWPNIKIDDTSVVEGHDIVFLASFAKPGDIFEQCGILYALPSYGARSLTVILPFFSTGTMDRVDQDGEIATAKTLARMLSQIPHCHGSGPAQIIILDIHALQEQFYFSDNVRVKLISAMPAIRDAIVHKLGRDVRIAFPDEGARKRFKKFFEGFELITCDKRREGDKRIVTIKDGDPSGKNVVIVDDLIMSGGTAIECAAVLRAAGASTVSLAATHAVMPGDALYRMKQSPLDHIWVTDSCPRIAENITVLTDQKIAHPFTMIPLSHQFKRVVYDVSVRNL